MALANLGHCYHEFHRDWPRAAYWWGKLSEGDIANLSAGHHPIIINLAHSYWKMGDKGTAYHYLKKYKVDRTRYGAAIKLWADMGNLDMALKLAKKSSGGFNAEALCAAGDACRKFGQYPKAIDYYKKVLAIPNQGKDNFILKLNQDRAKDAMDNIKIFDNLDLEMIKNGTYTGTSMGYGGRLALVLGINRGRIDSVKVTKHEDKQFFSALTDTPKQIIDNYLLVKDI